MRVSTRLAVLCILPVCLSTTSFGQSVGLAAVGGPVASPGYAQLAPVSVKSVPTGYSVTSLTLDAVTGAVVSGASGNAAITPLLNSRSSSGNDDNFDTDDTLKNLPTIDGLDTLATFDGAFIGQAGVSQGEDFRFTMIGNDPKLGKTTKFPANIDEVDLKLLNADGSVFKTVPYAPFEKLTLESPNFEPLDYRSGHNIEYADAIHRAEFFKVMKHDWHTLLIPKVVNKVTISVPRFVNVRLKDGTIIQARSYFSGTAPDGSTFVEMLSPLFNLFFNNEVINEINIGNFTTDGINMTLFPNTYLFSLNTANPNVPGSCCTLGFHTYFLDDGIPESRWVTEYASWISPGLFGAGFQDVTALSHETTESFADPFVDNPTPSWQFPGVPAASKDCQANLEEGDPVEVLNNATSAIEVKEGKFDFIYHPQNMALYQWFEMGATSSAIDGAFSFPDESVLPISAVPCPQ